MDAAWPLDGDSWLAYDRFDPDGYNEDGHEEFHRLLGHRSVHSRDHYGFEPPPGLEEDLEAYEQLLRLTFDSEAGFDWGSNAVYVFVPRVDLQRGDLSRIIVTAAND